MAALTDSTNVGEGRRSDRANALSYIMRDFNRKATLEVAKIRADEVSTKKKTIDRVEGRQRVRMFADHCDTFNSGVERSLSVVGDEKYTQLLDFISRDTNKISRVDLEARKEKYSKGIQKPRKITKSEQNVCGPDISAEMDGAKSISFLSSPPSWKYHAPGLERQTQTPTSCGEGSAAPNIKKK